MKLGVATLDAAIIVMSYHDLYHVDEKNGWPAINASQFLEQIRTALKPGGVFLVIDHSAKPGTWAKAAQDLHRIDEEYARRDIARHGFVLEATWDGLRNPGDTRSKLVFDKAVRGRRTGLCSFIGGWVSELVPPTPQRPQIPPDLPACLHLLHQRRSDDHAVGVTAQAAHLLRRADAEAGADRE